MLLLTGIAGASVLDANVVLSGDSDLGILSVNLSFVTDPGGLASGPGNVTDVTADFVGNNPAVPNFALNYSDLQSFAYVAAPPFECGPRCAYDLRLCLSDGAGNFVNIATSYSYLYADQAGESEGMFGFGDAALGPQAGERGGVTTVSFTTTEVAPEPAGLSLAGFALAVGAVWAIRKRYWTGEKGAAGGWVQFRGTWS